MLELGSVILYSIYRVPIRKLSDTPSIVLAENLSIGYSCSSEKVRESRLMKGNYCLVASPQTAFSFAMQ